MGIVILLVIAGLVLVVFPARILECDAVIFADGVMHNDLIFMTYPHHLGYNYMLRGAALVGQRFDPPLNPIYIIQYVSMAVALGGVYLLYRLLIAIGTAQRRAVLLSGVLMFSYGYWHYARQADAHVISVFLLIWAAWAFYRFLARPTIAGGCLVGFLVGLATLSHQSAVLILPPMLLACILRGRQGVRLMRQTEALVAVFLLVGVLPYLVVGLFVKKADTAAEFSQWSSGLMRWGVWGNWRLRTLPGTMIGLVRNFTGSHYLLGFQAIAGLAQRLFSGASWQDELAIAASVPAWLRLPLVAVQTVVLAFTGRELFRAPSAWKRLFGDNRAFAVFLLAWIVVQSGFFAWWAPERVEFWIAWLVSVILVLGRAGSRGRGGWSASGVGGVAFLAGLFAVNFFGSIYPQSGPVVERDTDAAVAIGAVVKRGDIVVSDCHFCGRASECVESFERVNLLDPIVDRPARYQGTVYAYEGSVREGAPPGTDTVDEKVLAHLKSSTLATIDSLLVVAAAGDQAVYVLMTPLSADPRRALLYRRLMDFVEEHYDISAAVPVRSGLDLRRITSGRRDATLHSLPQEWQGYVLTGGGRCC